MPFFSLLHCSQPIIFYKQTAEWSNTFICISLMQYALVSSANKYFSVKQTCCGAVKHCASLWLHVSPGVYWALCVQSQRGHGSHRGRQKQPKRGCHKWVHTLSAFSVAASHGFNLTESPDCSKTPISRCVCATHISKRKQAWLIIHSMMEH